MATKADLESALITAIRENDDVQKRTLRMALSAIKLAEIEKGATLDEAGVATILQKEIKVRYEAIAEAEHANRVDLVTANNAEIQVIKKFLPQQLSPEEIEVIARAAIAEVGATSLRDMGQVMKLLMPRVQGRADGSQLNQIVRQLLE